MKEAVSNIMNREDFNLNKNSPHIEMYYEYLNSFVKKMLGNDRISIRQVITDEDFAELSDARIRMYGQRDEYLSSMYPDGKATDESDLHAYVFACYLDGKIIGSQRLTPNNFEVKQYINEDALVAFLGGEYHYNYVEFSRLVVDKESKIKGVANALVMVAGTIVALTTQYNRLVSYSRPKVNTQIKAFSIDNEVIRFNIKERNNNEYILYKKDMLDQFRSIFGLKNIDRENILTVLHERFTSRLEVA